MKTLTAAVLLPAMLAAASAAAVPGAAPAALAGTWMNPSSSVAVRMGACQDKLCGWIIWSNAHADEKARKKGIARLKGIALLQDYRQTGPNRWSGKVYVPDLGGSFGSTITVESPNMLRIKGCLIGGLICKSQRWHRV